MAEDQQPTGRDADHAHDGEAAEAIRARLAEAQELWLFHEATDDIVAGHGAHMGQMLYRLPADGQTRDMKASIESLVADLETALADLDAANAEVERATTMNADWQAEYRKARGRALQWSGRFFAANRTVVEQAATIEAVRALADKWARYGEGSTFQDILGQQVVTVDFAVEKLRAVLSVVDGEKRNHDQEAT